MSRGNGLSAAQQPGPLCVVGAGYVGLVTAVCLADSGVEVRLLDVDQTRLALLRSGRSPIHEPLLDDLLSKVLRRGRLVLCNDVAEAMRGARMAMLAVGTPPLADGRADLSQVRAALGEVVANATESDTVVVIKSTVPPGTTAALRALCRRSGRTFPLCVCPEFLSEGSAVKDFHHPPQVVIGGDDRVACERVARLFEYLDAPVRITDSTSAELIKYGTNSFLALKISFINEMAHLCELTGADVQVVADGIGTDSRIGRAFLGAGLGFGGSCFPKDVRALDMAASYHGQSFWLLRAAVEVNAQQRSRFVAKIQKALRGNLANKRIAVLGLAFKPGTDDIRAAASIDVIRHLEDLGARVVATDPVAGAKAAAQLPFTEIVADPYECVSGADAVVLVTEWPEYVALDWRRIAPLVKRHLVIDGRNCLDGEALVAAGFTYISMGRAVRRPGRPAQTDHTLRPELLASGIG
ncbi:MAG: UDP-glucose/GDP-mannose dehydrogenase family protein [Candidatus Dormibacteraeota bacterium]|nr:UDP-glucose/GDP-mannose dehydrogenase family protein [Candidatus Dormibacteraeota bacterium]